jgi:hypothetical protein
VSCRPHLEKLAVLIEDLHPLVFAIGDEPPAVAAETDAVD